MKIFKGQITKLREEGYLTLQIQDLAFGGNPEIEEIPDSWVWRTNLRRLSVGGEQGFLHISPQGYLANKEKILDAYANGLLRGDAPVEPEKRRIFFDNFAQNEFDLIIKGTKKFAKNLRQKARKVEKTILSCLKIRPKLNNKLNNRLSENRGKTK